MYVANRAAVVSILLIATVPLSTYALISSRERHEKTQDLTKAVEQAAETYKAGSWLKRTKKQNEEKMKEKMQEMQGVARQKREVRLQIAALIKVIDRLKEVHNIDIHDPESLQAGIEREKADLFTYLKTFVARRMTLASVSTDDSHDFFRGLVHTSLGEAVERDMYRRAVGQARIQLYQFIADAEQLPDDISALRDVHAALLDEYRKVESQHDYYSSLVLTDAKLAQIRREVEEVHAQVLRMQSELARIDARIRRQAERTLIEKGLKSAKTGAYSTGEISTLNPEFMWPAYGAISAGFHSPSYEEYFGVPHSAIDIVIPQGSPVFASADGVVFLSRDGGPRGYSYVLVGHRGGYATLYGHLSQINVSNGQDVSKGQVIGLSGGMPGTHGAGLMTTGPHLHFEVIKSGVNINPMSVLK